MKSVSAGLASHLAQECTTLATCWKCTRLDGTVYGFTDHDQDLVVDGVTYDAATGYTRSAIKTTGALNVDGLDLEGAFDSVAITDADLHAGKWDYAAIEVFMVNWADLTQGTLKLRRGRLGEIRSGRQIFVAELRGLTQLLQQRVGRTYGQNCDADLGDARCGVTLASYTFSGSVTGVTSNRVFASSGRTEADAYFDNGKITFTSGNNNGLAMEIKTWVNSGKTFSLYLPMPYTVQVGDTYSVVAGCRKRFAQDCVAKFSNGRNFRGFPHIPGTNRLVSGGL